MQRGTLPTAWSSAELRDVGAERRRYGPTLQNAAGVSDGKMSKIGDVIFTSRVVGCIYVIFAHVLQATVGVVKQSNSIIKPKEHLMNYPHIVSRDEWLVARKELLIKEKEATRARDRLNAERRRLPMVRIDKEYLFEGPGGKASLCDLFDGRRQLIVYHFMFDPSWEEGCKSCSNLVDNVPSRLARLHARDTSLVLVSRAPLAKIEPFKALMNWSIPWFSSYGSDFNYDFDATDEGGEKPGLSVFLRDGGQILHTYSTTGRGVDILLGTYNYLDLTPLGRQEDWEERPNRSSPPAAQG
jgi:predicted dithiol-disulfide oxidoreductase (DUF899 family)